MPKDNIKVAVMPIDITSLDIERNINLIGDKLRSLPCDIDLVVFPELCFTGFVDDTVSMHTSAQENSGKCMNMVRQWARQYEIAICGSFVAKNTVSARGAIFNRAFFITPEGNECFYDKRHLFSLGAEAEIFTAGEALMPVIEYKGWRFAIVICYDLRFPVWCRNVNLAYDALIVPANWPTSRAFAWHQLLSARGIENQSLVLACNRLGTDAGGEYSAADSVIIDNWGKTIATADNELGYATCELNGHHLVKSRLSFSPWRDADKFEIENLSTQ